MAWMDTVECYETDFLLLDGTAGVELIPCDLVDYHPTPADSRWRRVPEALRAHTESRECWEVRREHGWIARYTAPGYIDCTPWVNANTREDALAQLQEIYGAEEEEED